MQAGRPILIVPAEINTLKPERVLVAWKDTRESRRSILDALPLLQIASHVVVVEIAVEEDLAEANRHLEDLIYRLKRHGAEAKTIAALATNDDAAQLSSIFVERDASVVVAGAYGHSRVREWAFGGVTRDLPLRGNCCALVSH